MLNSSRLPGTQKDRQAEIPDVVYVFPRDAFLFLDKERNMRISVSTLKPYRCLPIQLRVQNLIKAEDL
jgi:hypothetical protein